MNRMVDRLDRALYPGQSSNWDDYIFRDRILSNLSPEAIILDIGAGAGIVQQMNFKGMVAKVCGIDLDPRVECNPMLDRSEEHTSELQSRVDLVCRLLLEKKKKINERMS